MLHLPDLSTNQPGPLSARRLLQLAHDRLRQTPGAVVRVTLEDRRVFMATIEGEAPGELLVRPRWPDAAGRRPLLFLPWNEVVRVEGRRDRAGRQAAVVGACTVVGALLTQGPRLLMGGDPTPMTPALIGGGVLGMLLGALGVFVAQRHPALSEWHSLPVVPDQGESSGRATSNTT